MTLLRRLARVGSGMTDAQRLEFRDVFAPAKPQVLRREVYTKAEAVRKLLVVRQSLENAVPFLVYWTDFSAKRKEPLRVSSAFAFTESRATALAEKLIAENVTKGFVRA
jgi:hypothetical protein